LLSSLPGLLLRLGTLLLLRLGTLLLLWLGTLLLGLSLLGGWGFLGRLGLLLLLLLMLCARRNCDSKNQEQKCSADDSDWLHSVLLINVTILWANGFARLCKTALLAKYLILIAFQPDVCMLSFSGG